MLVLKAGSALSLLISRGKHIQVKLCLFFILANEFSESWSR